MLRKAWQRWLKFAEIVGTIQMVIALSIIYWVFLPFIAVPFKLKSDSLALHRSRRNHWIDRDVPADVLDSMKKQY